MTADEVKVEPHRAKLSLDELRTLARSLPSGQFQPPAATYVAGRGYVVLAGERRWGAMLLRDEPLFIVKIASWPDMLAWMIQDSTSGAPSKPMNLVDAAAMSEKINRYLTPKRNDYADQTVAEYLGVHLKSMRDARYLSNWLEPGYPEVIQEMARREIADVAAGRVTPHGSYDRIKRALASLNAATNAMPAPKQRSLLNNLVAQATGLVDGLQALGPLADTLEPGECATWARQLGDTRRALERTIKALKERGTS